MREKRGWRLALLASSLTFLLAGSIAIGYLVGAYLDRRLGSEGLLTALFIVLGIVAGFINIYRAAKKG